jgi:hypothetical protein
MENTAKKRVILGAAQWELRWVCRRQEKERSDSVSGTVGMTAGTLPASEKNKRFSEWRGGDDASRGQEKETSNFESSAVGMAAGIASVRERN